MDGRIPMCEFCKIEWNSHWFLGLGKVSAGRERTWGWEKRMHMDLEMGTCVLFWRKCSISHSHQTSPNTMFGFSFWVKAIISTRGFGLHLGSTLSSGDLTDCLWSFLYLSQLCKFGTTSWPRKLDHQAGFLYSSFISILSVIFLLLLFLNLAAVSSRRSPSLLARDISLACFNNLNLLG